MKEDKKREDLLNPDRYNLDVANWEIASSCRVDAVTQLNRCCKIKKTGFYGLDVYSLWSCWTHMKYLENHDPVALEKPSLSMF